MRFGRRARNGLLWGAVLLSTVVYGEAAVRSVAEPASRPLLFASPRSTRSLVPTPDVASARVATPQPTPATKEGRMPTPPSRRTPPGLRPVPRGSLITPAPPGEVIPPPFEAGIEMLVREARMDLAQRLSIAPDTITVVEVRSVIWSDGSLGCPKPGMAYPQVQVEGIWIRLQAAGRHFNYHSGGSQRPFLCQKPVLRPGRERASGNS